MAFVLRKIRSPTDLDTALACVGLLRDERFAQVVHIAAYKHMLKLIERLSAAGGTQDNIVWPNQARCQGALPCDRIGSTSRNSPPASEPSPQRCSRKRMRAHAPAHLSGDKEPMRKVANHNISTTVLLSELPVTSASSRQSRVPADEADEAGGALLRNSPEVRHFPASMECK